MQHTAQKKHNDTDEIKREEVQIVTEGCRSGLHIFATQIKLKWKFLQGSNTLIQYNVRIMTLLVLKYITKALSYWLDVIFCQI